MNFDISSAQLANNFLQEVERKILKKQINEKRTKPIFTETIIDEIRSTQNPIDIKSIKVHGYHCLASTDDCSDIKKYGLLNLRNAVSENTCLARAFKSIGITFDLNEMCVKHNAEIFSLNSRNYQGYLSSAKGRIALRFSRDYGITAFLCTPSPKGYGTEIHRKPEIINDFSSLGSDFQALEEQWVSISNSYCVHFAANLNDVNLEDTFDISSDASPKEILIKLIESSLETFESSNREKYLFLKQDVNIPPEKIICVTQI